MAKQTLKEKTAKAEQVEKEANKRSARSRSRTAATAKKSSVSAPKKAERKTPVKKAAAKKENAGKARKSKQQSVSEAESEEEQPNDNVTYEKGTFLAFVDSSDSLNQYKIAHVTRDVSSGDEEMTVNVFKVDTKIPTQFKLQAKNQTMFDNQVICDVKVEVTKSTGKKVLVADELKITKQLNNKVAKLMPTIVEALKEDRSDKTESDESEAESENSDDKIALTQPAEKRKILKVVGIKKQKAPPATQVASRSKSKGK